MGWVRSIGAELLGLFVDDGRIAVALLIWLALCWLLLPRLGLPAPLPPLLLFAGLAAIVVESAWRRAGQGKPTGTRR